VPVGLDGQIGSKPGFLALYMNSVTSQYNEDVYFRPQAAHARLTLVHLQRRLDLLGSTSIMEPMT
jgi:hypothetical protein